MLIKVSDDRELLRIARGLKLEKTGRKILVCQWVEMRDEG